MTSMELYYDCLFPLHTGLFTIPDGGKCLRVSVFRGAQCQEKSPLALSRRQERVEKEVTNPDELMTGLRPV